MSSYYHHTEDKNAFGDVLYRIQSIARTEAKLLRQTSGVIVLPLELHILLLFNSLKETQRPKNVSANSPRMA